MHMNCYTMLVRGDGMATTNVTIRMEKKLKEEAEQLFNDLGLNMSTALTAFVKQAVREQRIPFIISKNVYNQETLQAIQEVEKMKTDKNVKTYSSFSELVNEVNNEE